MSSPSKRVTRWITLLAVLLCLASLCLAHQLLPSACLRLVGGFADTPTPTAWHSPSASGELERPATETPSASPTLSPPTTQPTEAAEAATVLTVLYDNNPADPRLTSAWGFACLIEAAAGAVLFDTGGDGAILLQNMATLGIDPAAIDAVVLSHNHNDHTGGLAALLASNDHLVVYVPASFATEISRLVGGRAEIVEVAGPTEILEGVNTTGEMGAAIVEQSLIVETARGLVVVTGCAHPGIVEIVRRAVALGEIDLVIGGFHLSDRSRSDVQVVIEDLLALGVRRVAPCHCTGADATAEFEAGFGSGFVPCGVGTRITIEP